MPKNTYTVTDAGAKKVARKLAKLTDAQKREVNKAGDNGKYAQVDKTPKK